MNSEKCERCRGDGVLFDRVSPGVMKSCCDCKGTGKADTPTAGRQIAEAMSGKGIVNSNLDPSSTQEKPEDLDEAIAEIQWGNFVGHYLRDEDGNFHPIADSYGVLDEHFKNDVKSLINSEVAKRVVAELISLYKEIQQSQYWNIGGDRGLTWDIQKSINPVIAKYKEVE